MNLKNIFYAVALLFISGQAFAQTFTNYTTTDGLINDAVNCLTVDANDHLWFGTQEGISHFDGTIWTNYNTTTHPELIHNTITAIAVDADNNVWFGTDFGISYYDGENWLTYTEDSGLGDNRVRYIRDDLDGNIWVGHNDGVSVWDGANWTTYTTLDGLPFGGVTHITVDADGNKWLGTALGGVVVYDGISFTAITETEGLLNDKVRSVAIDAENSKWVGNADGISVFNNANELTAHHTIMYVLPPPDTLNPVEDIQIDSKGNVWVGIYVDYLVTVGGVAMYNGSTWIDYDESDGLVGPVVRQLAIDSNDDVWVATSTGISKITDISTATQNRETVASFNVYPNPVQEVLTIERGAMDILKTQVVEVYNGLGQQVARNQFAHGQSVLHIDATHLTAGIYIVQLDNRSFKIIK